MNNALYGHALWRFANTLERAGRIDPIQELALAMSQSPQFCRRVCPGSDALQMDRDHALAIAVGAISRLWIYVADGISDLSVTEACEIAKVDYVWLMIMSGLGLANPTKLGYDFSPILDLDWNKSAEERKVEKRQEKIQAERKKAIAKARAKLKREGTSTSDS